MLIRIKSAKKKGGRVSKAEKERLQKEEEERRLKEEGRTFILTSRTSLSRVWCRYSSSRFRYAGTQVYHIKCQ